MNTQSQSPQALLDLTAWYEWLAELEAEARDYYHLAYSDSAYDF